ncbi:uncharacterized protein [Dysidea avara]|uniref:uncharacterized protein isoform X2 n=1 Tax=Dysidea avara TaxID=196820 RepID=UPI003329494B
MCVSSNVNPPIRLLWDVISAQCSPAELIEVRRILGESLIEQTCELHAELQCLSEILQVASCSHNTRDHTLDKRLVQQANCLLEVLRSQSEEAIEAVAHDIRMKLQFECDQLQGHITNLQQVDAFDSPSPKPLSSSGRQSSLDRPTTASGGRISRVERFRQMIADNRTETADNDS